MPASVAKSSPPSDDRRWKVVDARMRRLGYRPDALIETLHTVQESFGFLEPEALGYVSDALHVPPSRVFGVATFYSFFTLKPQGDHTCVVCTGTACYINGSSKILELVHDRLGVRERETTLDGTVSVLSARCIGACSLAPAVVIDGHVRGRQTPEAVVVELEALRSQPAGVAP
jgi:bidirectional [NiFe] hydrogenase diaphorase subunit